MYFSKVFFPKCIFEKCTQLTHFLSLSSLSKCKPKCCIQFNEDDDEGDEEDEVGSRVASGEEGKETRDFHLAENPHSSRFVIGRLRMTMIMTDGDDVTMTI